MNLNRYLLPVTVAACLHGALLLGLSRSSALRPVPPDGPPRIRIVDPPPIFDIPDPGEKGESAGGSGTPVSELPEPPPLREQARPLDFVVATEPTQLRWERTATLVGFDGRPAGPGLDWGRPASRGPVSFADLDRPPRARMQIPPDYPSELRQNGIGGTVVVEFMVDTEGRVVRAEAVRFSRREFVEPAIRAVLKWRFEPGYKDARRVPFRIVVPIEFGLDSV